MAKKAAELAKFFKFIMELCIGVRRMKSVHTNPLNHIVNSSSWLTALTTTFAPWRQLAVTNEIYMFSNKLLLNKNLTFSCIFHFILHIFYRPKVSFLNHVNVNKIESKLRLKIICMFNGFFADTLIVNVIKIEPNEINFQFYMLKVLPSRTMLISYWNFQTFT